MTIAALVLAAGRGLRFGGATPKAYVLLKEKPLLVHSMAALHCVKAIDQVVPVIAKQDRQRFSELALAWPEELGLVEPVLGGAERQDSVAAGLSSLPKEVSLVVVHDAARPMVRSGDIIRVVEVAQKTGAALLAVPVQDTIKRGRDGVVIETPPRMECYAAQTPQVFRREILQQALEQAKQDSFEGTDCAQLVERVEQEQVEKLYR